MKRTYNLRPGTVVTVERLVGPQVGATRDAETKRSARDLDRAVRDRLHAHAWADAGRNPAFQAEMAAIWDGVASDDRHAWEQGVE
jgi:hypothetical protein